MTLSSKRNLMYISCVLVTLLLVHCHEISAQEDDIGKMNNNTNSENEAREEVGGRRGLYRRPFHKNADRVICKRSLYNDILHQWEHFTENTSQFFGQFIPKPIRNIFDKFDKNKSVEEDGNEVTPKVIDIFVADVLHGIAKVTDSVKKTIDTVGENIVKTFIPSTGLDSNKTFFSGLQAEFKSKVQAIYPGTLWCGDGTRAREFGDLGTFDKTDNCCRSHDFCTNSIESGQSKYGLINSGLFTRSHCDCDIEFYDCLKQANTLIALKIGFTYFTVLGPQCFKEEYPIKQCSRNKRGPLGAKRCLVYETDENKSQIYQWFDAKFF